MSYQKLKDGDLPCYTECLAELYYAAMWKELLSSKFGCTAKEIPSKIPKVLLWFLAAYSKI